jgi:hypothetical protein
VPSARAGITRSETENDEGPYSPSPEEIRVSGGVADLKKDNGHAKEYSRCPSNALTNGCNTKEANYADRPMDVLSRARHRTIRSDN